MTDVTFVTFRQLRVAEVTIVHRGPLGGRSDGRAGCSQYALSSRDSARPGVLMGGVARLAAATRPIWSSAMLVEARSRRIVFVRRSESWSDDPSSKLHAR